MTGHASAGAARLTFGVLNNLAPKLELKCGSYYLKASWILSRSQVSAHMANIAPIVRANYPRVAAANSAYFPPATTPHQDVWRKRTASKIREDFLIRSKVMTWMLVRRMLRRLCGSSFFSNHSFDTSFDNPFHCFRKKFYKPIVCSNHEDVGALFGYRM